MLFCQVFFGLAWGAIVGKALYDGKTTYAELEGAAND